MYDLVREGVVIFTGALAKHLGKDDLKVHSVVEKLLDVLNTPSEVVQRAVSSCLSPLMSSKQGLVLVNPGRLWPSYRCQSVWSGVGFFCSSGHRDMGGLLVQVCFGMGYISSLLGQLVLSCLLMFYNLKQVQQMPIECLFLLDKAEIPE
ncbi:hypothetical protein SOVF_146160 [Spinacia oleracea]|nr:hypothetical protein SOVF_146160 [Spinacia oleracea]